MAKKQPGGVGTGRGVLDGGTADKFGRTPAQQGKGGGRLLPSEHNLLGGKKTPKPSYPKKSIPKSASLKRGTHGIVRGVKGS